MSSEIIAENRRLYASDIVSFEHASLLNTSLPRADLIIARDILFHLNSAHIVSALANFRRSDSPWLLTTTFPWVTSNKDLEPKSEPYLGFQAQPHKPVWGYREINLDIAPFDLGANGLESLEERWGDDEDTTATRLLKLYALPHPNHTPPLSQPNHTPPAAETTETPDANESAKHFDTPPHTPGSDDDPDELVVRVVQACPGLALVLEWHSGEASRTGDWIGVFHHEPVNARSARVPWGDEDMIFSVRVAAGVHYQRIETNVSEASGGGFVMPVGGPWIVAYFDAERRDEPVQVGFGLDGGRGGVCGGMGRGYARKKQEGHWVGGR